MKQLFDFSKTREANFLLKSMGILDIKPLPSLNEFVPDSFTETIKSPELIAYEDMINIGLTIAPNDIEVSDEGILEVNGYKCCIYIKEQAEFVRGQRMIDLDRETSRYRFHLCNCKTIQTMRKHNKGERYVATPRDDSWFPVELLDKTGTHLLKMQLCKNCADLLWQRGMYVGNPREVWAFSLKEFFKKYQSSIPEMYVEKRTETRHLTAEELEEQYKKSNNYVCQLCKKNYASYPNQLHLMHMDGNKANYKNNIFLYCTDCLRYMNECK